MTSRRQLRSDRSLKLVKSGQHFTVTLGDFGNGFARTLGKDMHPSFHAQTNPPAQVPPPPQSADQYLKTIVERATRHVRNDTPPKIMPVWKSALCSVNGGPQVQAIVGESHQGFHAGIRCFEPGKQMREAWGPAVATKQEAIQASQHRAAESLMERKGRSRGR